MKVLMTKDGMYFTVESEIQHDAFIAGGWTDVQPSDEKPKKEEKPSKKKK